MTGGGVLRAAGEGAARAEGAITIDTVPAVLDAGADLLAGAGSEVEVDLSGITEFDSAALGVLLEWRRRSAVRGAQLAYTGLPPKLLTLATLYGVADLLGVAPAAG